MKTIGKSFFIIIFILLLFSSISNAEGEPALKNPPKGNPVTIAGRELFLINSGVGSFTPAERAQAVSKRLNQIVSSPFSYSGAVEVVKDGGQFNIVIDDLVLMSVTGQDVDGPDTSPELLAKAYADEINNALLLARAEQTDKGVMLSTAYAVIAVVALLLAVLLLRFLTKRVEAKLLSWRGTLIKNLKFQKVDILSAEALANFLIRLVHFGRFVLVLICIYVFVPLALSFFPLTRNYSHLLIGYVSKPLKIIFEALVSFVPNLFFIAVISIVTYYVLKIIKLVFDEIQAGAIKLSWFYPDWAKPTYQLLRFLILAMALISAFPYIPGSDSPAFKGVSLFLGVLVSFSSSSSISNIIAGVIITYTRGFKVGDRAQIGETIGDIVETSLLVTRIRTIKNVVVTIPNSIVMNSHITNYSTSSAEHSPLILHTTVTIGYDAPWRKVHELLISAALKTSNVLKTPAPFVLQTSLDDFFVSYQINAYTDNPSVMAETYGELHQNIQDSFNEGGVEIMSPHYASLRDGNTVTIPAEKRPPDYKSPGFKVDRGSNT